MYSHNCTVYLHQDICIDQAPVNCYYGQVVYDVKRPGREWLMRFLSCKDLNALKEVCACSMYDNHKPLSSLFVKNFRMLILVVKYLLILKMLMVTLNYVLILFGSLKDGQLGLTNFQQE